jgi:hypothetical protein
MIDQSLPSTVEVKIYRAIPTLCHEASWLTKLSPVLFEKPTSASGYKKLSAFMELEGPLQRDYSDSHGGQYEYDYLLGCCAV